MGYKANPKWKPKHSGRSSVARRMSCSSCISQPFTARPVNPNGEKVEAIRARDRERAHEEHVVEAVGGDAGADFESKREDNDGGGDFVLGQLAPAEGEVGSEAIDPGDDAGVPALFAEAELGAEGALHFGGVIADGDGFFDVGGGLLIDFLIEYLIKCSRSFL